MKLRVYIASVTNMPSKTSVHSGRQLGICRRRGQGLRRGLTEEHLVVRDAAVEAVGELYDTIDRSRQ